MSTAKDSGCDAQKWSAPKQSPKCSASSYSMYWYCIVFYFVPCLVHCIVLCLLYCIVLYLVISYLFIVLCFIALYFIIVNCIAFSNKHINVYVATYGRLCSFGVGNYFASNVRWKYIDIGFK